MRIKTRSKIEKLKLLMMEESCEAAWIEWSLKSNRKYAISTKI